MALPLGEVRADRAAVAIVKNDLGADQVGAAIAAAGVRAVTGDALGRVHLSPTGRGFFVDHLLIGGTGRECRAASAAARRRSFGGSAAAARSRAVLRGQVVEDGRELLVGGFGAALHHGADVGLPCRAAAPLLGDNFDGVAGAADLFKNLLGGR